MTDDLDIDGNPEVHAAAERMRKHVMQRTAKAINDLGPVGIVAIPLGALAGVAEVLCVSARQGGTPLTKEAWLDACSSTFDQADLNSIIFASGGSKQ